MGAVIILRKVGQGKWAYNISIGRNI